MIFDNNGVPVWWMHGEAPPLDFKLLDNGDVSFLASTRVTGLSSMSSVSTAPS